MNAKQFFDLTAKVRKAQKECPYFYKCYPEVNQSFNEDW